MRICQEDAQRTRQTPQVERRGYRPQLSPLQLVSADLGQIGDGKAGQTLSIESMLPIKRSSQERLYQITPLATPRAQPSWWILGSGRPSEYN